VDRDATKSKDVDDGRAYGRGHGSRDQYRGEKRGDSDRPHAPRDAPPTAPSDVGEHTVAQIVRCVDGQPSAQSSQLLGQFHRIVKSSAIPTSMFELGECAA
jgi:hypothetical protein